MLQICVVYGRLRVPNWWHCRSSQLPVPVRRRARSTPPLATPAPPRRLRPLPDSAPLPGISQPRKDILRTLSPIPFSDRDSSATTSSLDNEKKHAPYDELSFKSVIGEGETTEIDGTREVDEDVAPPPRSPSIRIEDYSEKTIPSPRGSPDRADRDSLTLHDTETKVFGDNESYLVSQTSFDVDSINSPSRRSPVRRSPPSRRSPSPAPASDRSSAASPVRSRAATPAAESEPYSPAAAAAAGAGAGRDVRRALAECTAPARPEDWEVVVGRLQEIERLAGDEAARAPAAAWRAAARAGGAHVRSLRSRVARAACRSLGALFQHRGRALDPELEDAAGALLERCADVNRFLRADATEALARVARGGGAGRAAAALARRGAGHRAGPVRAAAAHALAALVAQHSAARVLALPPEPRAALLRAAGELLGDAGAAAREQARRLCSLLAEDPRFLPLLKEAMPPARYRAVEKYIDRLPCR
ncbi:hypothetical protein JYU34_009024 [Plutella xylostella]|uniref:TOG domain-containing protein n=1 Tax=Plutella xylostella TaxID=51655 RepID=A0ABQ7QMX2_PLUXY|nr:hypothetical protein JYU34_009024 [Plutella xylostella]